MVGVLCLVVLSVFRLILCGMMRCFFMSISMVMMVLVLVFFIRLVGLVWLLIL